MGQTLKVLDPTFPRMKRLSLDIRRWKAPLSGSVKDVINYTITLLYKLLNSKKRISYSVYITFIAKQSCVKGAFKQLKNKNKTRFEKFNVIILK